MNELSLILSFSLGGDIYYVLRSHECYYEAVYACHVCTVAYHGEMESGCPYLLELYFYPLSPKREKSSSHSQARV